jgi:sulfonate transport system permease protein
MLVKSAENPSASNADPSNAMRFLRPAYGVIIPLGLALAWEIAVWLGVSSGRLMPPPSRIYTELVELAQKGGVTLLRVVAGFFIGAIGGTLLGAISGYSTLVRRLIDPSLQGLRAVPSIAWIPLFILWFGIFETSKVALIAFGVFFPV